MRVTVPKWVTHSKDAPVAIYSVDIHPDGTRFVTAGGDHSIKIWSIKCIRNSKDKSPRLLFSKQNCHSSPVNCVRWSNNGRALASVSDDRSIKLWELVQGFAPTLGVEASVEYWKDVVTFNCAHEKDIVGVCWSPDDSLIATCSLDNTIIIWDIANQKKLHVLREHTNFVKGIAWDPIGKYLASQSDDMTVNIWKVENWTLEHSIKEPYIHPSSGNSFFCRLDWSPEGSHLVTSRGVSGNNHTAVILPRGKWEPPQDFVGHSKPVVSVRFNGCLFEDKGQYSGICAIGSMNGEISIWSTARPNALASIVNVFSQSVQDLSWSKDGLMCIACSTDGKVCVIEFEEKDKIGVVVPKEARIAFLKNLYGDTICESNIIENTNQLLFESSVDQNDQQNVQAPPSDKMDIVNTSPKQIPVIAPIAMNVTEIKQKEQVLPDGRKRITPTFLGCYRPNFAGPSATPAVAPTVISTSAPTPETLSPTDKAPTPSSNPNPNPIVNNNTNANVSNSNAASSNSSESSAAIPKKTANEVDSKKRKLTLKSPDNAKKKKISEQPETPPPSPSAKKKIIEKPRTEPVRAIQDQQEKILFKDKIFFEPPPEKNSLSFHLSINNTPSYVVSTTYVDKAAIVECARGGVVEWQQYIEGKPSLITGNSNFVAIACTNGLLNIFSPAGRRLFPPIAVGIIAFLESNEEFLLSLSCNCILNIWNVKNEVNTHQQNIQSIFSDPGSSVKVSITKFGLPVIATSKGESFTIHPKMKIWICVADGNCQPENPPKSGGTLNELQSEANQMRDSSSQAKNPTEIEKLSFQAMQVASAKALTSPQEYKHWLITYVRTLTQYDKETTIREICDELIVPTSSMEEWEPKILGLDKKELLHHLLKIISCNRKMQKLVDYYKELLDQKPIIQ